MYYTCHSLKQNHHFMSITKYPVIYTQQKLEANHWINNYNVPLKRRRSHSLHSHLLGLILFLKHSDG